METNIPRRQMAGFIFTAVLGTCLHFLFDLAGGSLVVGLFCAVNESIWEHMKLLFYPMLLFALREYLLWGRHVPGYWCIRLTGTVLGLCLIPVVYYTYTGIGGVSADWFNVTIFFISAAAAYLLETELFRKKVCFLPSGAALAGILLLALAFTVMTFLPPRIPLFQDPVTGTYGWLQR